MALEGSPDRALRPGVKRQDQATTALRFGADVIGVGTR